MNNYTNRSYAIRNVHEKVKSFITWQMCTFFRHLLFPWNKCFDKHHKNLYESHMTLTHRDYHAVKPTTTDVLKILHAIRLACAYASEKVYACPVLPMFVFCMCLPVAVIQFYSPYLHLFSSRTETLAVQHLHV